MKPAKDSTYWRRKLSAYMHDSPEKVLDIVGHARRAEQLQQVDAFSVMESYQKAADHAASAADRLPWPDPRKSGLKSPFRGDAQSPFRHPLGGTNIPFTRSFRTVEEALQGSFQTRPVIEEEDPRMAFIARWRFWKNWASDLNPQFGFLPAESRLPDHTIWNHMQVTSALQGCTDEQGTLRPAFLLVSLGPVQDFIAAARSTRDLWSGSYLLSYLVANALAEVALRLGPDQVIFPNLQNQPLLDLLMKPVWDTMHTRSGESLWQAFQYYDREKGVPRLLTPTLPNRFLLLVPADEAEEIGGWMETILRDKLQEIGQSVAETAAALNRGKQRFRADRFHRQIEAMPEIFWQALPWPKDYRSAKSWLESMPLPADSEASILDSLEKVLAAVAEEHEDSRISTKGVPHSVAAAWPVLYHMVEWLHSGTKNSRLFTAWDGASSWRYGTSENKDSLNGKEEAVLMVGEEADAEALRHAMGPGWEQTTFRPNERIGASTLLKRLWHRSYLAKQHPFNPDDGVFAMPDTHGIAKGSLLEQASPNPSEDESAGYYAILALDGDEMGKWISGSKMPFLEDQLSPEAREWFSHKASEVLSSTRPLNPSFHLQFSEMLANFSLYCVQPIVEAYRGRLIYAGGDDVLAMLPADTAMDCAYALRQAFRGDNEWLSKNVTGARSFGSRFEKDSFDPHVPLFDPEWKAPGTIKWIPASADRGDQPLVSDPRHFPVLVPGPRADCSVGIAFGHAMAPLQDMVGAAQEAEKRAKRDVAEGGQGRAAVAITIFKRSGETLQWGARWPVYEQQETGINLFKELLADMASGLLSARFPYRFMELIGLYGGKSSSVGTDSGFSRNLADIMSRDFEESLHRQGIRAAASRQSGLKQDFANYLAWLQEQTRDHANPTEQILNSVNGLFQTLAWVSKNHD